MSYDGPGISPSDIYSARQLCDDAGGDCSKLVYHYDDATACWCAWEVADLAAPRDESGVETVERRCMGSAMSRRPRSCGGCTACCTYLPIKALNKPALTPCEHLTADGVGCSIYADGRPSACEHYSCMWRYGYGKEEDRPDRSGVLIDNLLPIANAVQAKPIRAGAADTPRGMSAIRRISKERNQPALVAGFPETHMVRVVGRGSASMANASVAFDGTRVNDADALGSIWTDLGGGKCASEPDFVYQGNAAVSEKVGTSEGGVALDMVATVDYTTPKVWIAKHIATNSAALNNKGATGGILEIGSGGRRANYDRYYVVGGDTYPIVGGWLITPIDPNGGNQSARPGTAPTLSAIDYYGWACDFGATSKAENVACDAVDFITNGTGLTLTDGIAGTDGTFALFGTTDEDAAGNNRWGIVSTREGVLYVTGVITIGDSGTGAEFTDTGAVVVWPDAEFLNSVGFFGLDVVLSNASTVVAITSCVFISRGTSGGTVDTRAVFEVSGTSGTLTLTSCRFANMADFILTAGATLDGCDIETVAMTQGSADVENCVIRTGSATSIATLQDPTFGTTTDLNNSEFIQAGAGHAVEISAAGNYTLTELTWTGYGADTTDSAALDLTAATGTYNLTISGGTTPTYKKLAGATVNILNDVTVTITGLKSGSEVRVYETGTLTVVDGVESSGTTFAFSEAAAAGVDIRIFHLDWKDLFIENYIIPSTATDLPVQQIVDRVYVNP